MRRYVSLDLLRGIGILGVIFFHSAVYYYGDIDNVDFENPPLLIAIIGTIALWGGLFAVISGVANLSMATLRIQAKEDVYKNTFRNLSISGLFLLVFHYVYNIFLGPTSFNFETGFHKYSFIAGSLREGALYSIPIKRFFEGSALSMLGWNLIFFGIILYFIFRKKGIQKRKRNYRIIFVLGLISVLLGVMRLYLFPYCETFVNEGHYVLATILSFLADKPYPIFPYFGFGLFGALIGLMLFYRESKKRIKKIGFSLGFGWIFLAIIGFILVPETMLKVDLFWFNKVMLELGIFILLLTSFLLKFDLSEKKKLSKKIIWLEKFGMISFSIYLLQTPLSEIMAKIWDFLFPGWSMNLGVTFIFAGFNVLFWIVLVEFWKKKDFKYSAESLWVKILEKLDRESTKELAIKKYLFKNK